MPEAGARSLRRRLLGLLLGGLAAAWVVIAAATYADGRYHAARMLDAQLIEYSEVLGAIANHEVLEIAGSTTTHDPVFTQSCTYQVYALDGSLLLRSHDAPNAPLATGDGFADVHSAGVDWRTFRRSDPGHGLAIIVAHDVARRDALVRGLALRLVLPLLVGLPLLAVALWYAVTRALRPLERLARELRGREAGHLSPIAAPDAPAEVVPLVEATNQLFGRLERSFDNERRFTGDAAHELRTPLAALRTQAEVALTTESDERRRRALEQVVQGVERATRLVEQMLMLARLDAGDARPTFAPLDLPALLGEAVDEARERARGVDIVLDAHVAPKADGDAAMLRALVRNLIDNALRFTPESGQVRLSLASEGRWACLAVEDSGPGVAPGLRSRIFDRFFRGEDGRGPGSGLGLSIVRRIAELHGGTASASSSAALGGLRVEVRIPARP